MDKPGNEPNPELAAFRAQIDALDEKLIALLIERTGIVTKVGEMKRRTHPGQCPIRAGREAEMIRDIIKKFEGTIFSPAAAAAIWRLLIGASTAVEGALKLSVFATDNANDLYWMAREYFGGFLPITRQPQVKRVIGDVMDGKASVGIVPFLRSADTTYWWTNLMQGNDAPKVFAHIPFVYYETPGKDAPSALAIARIAPEPTGNDLSLLVIEADHNVSQNKLQTAFAGAKLEANWINVATISPTIRHHLVEIKGFVTPAHDEMKSFAATLGSSIINICFLGAYAVPVIMKSDHSHEHTANFNAAKSAKA